ncbi:MAG: DUF6624 domain-containing protein [Bacteroidota bacterium]
MKYPQVASTIIRLQAADLALRDELIARGELEGGYHPEMEALHHRNASELDEIINAIGYPTVERVGAAASDAAWLVIQHAIGRPDFMRKCARLLAEAVDHGQAQARNLAYLTDRIAVFEGRPQQYGTSFDWDEHGQLSPQPYDDLGKVNQRRQSLGMNTLEAQTQLIRQRNREEGGGPPPDLAARRAAYEAWRREVGWMGS